MSPREQRIIEKLTSAIERNAKATEEANRLIRPTKSHDRNIANGEIEAHTNSGAKLPAYLLARGEEIDFDEAAAHGYGRIDIDGFTIHIPSQYYTDLVRKILAEGEPVAFTVGLNHRKPVDD